MPRLAVRRELTCEIVVGRGSLGSLGRIVAGLEPYGVVLAHEGLLPRFLVELASSSLDEAGVRYSLLPLPSGESCKSLEVVSQVWRGLARVGATRDTLVVGIGGGALLDAVGFAASTYMRGCRVAYVPTTLLAQADASIGGKTAIDFEGKNDVGTFSLPELVVIDPETLRTLPERELRHGAAEIVKHAVIEGGDFFELIERAGRSLLEDWVLLEEAIKRSINVKIKHVEVDFEDSKGVRARLNFGHTVAHAIERASGYSVAHGEAVAAGMAVEARMAEELVGFPSKERERLLNVLRSLSLPAEIEINAERLLENARADKKFRRGRPVLALPVAIGRVEVVELSWREFEEALRRSIQ
ncbi:MAG: 3-dehydroquinate synthase [Fervidicoccaceae archaeon]